MNRPPAIRVLYAEDNPLDADLTRAYFSEHAPDISLEIVGTGRDCLARLSADHHDLLLLDHYLPDMEGLDVLRRVVHSTLPVPAVLVSGAGDEELVVKALRLGAASYVPKVGDYVETLPGLLRSVLDTDRVQRSRGLVPSAARRILYIEHNEMDIELTARHLGEAAPQLELEVVRSFQAAAARLARPPAFDAALIDLRMPGQSGLDFVRDLRASGLELPPFIMITGKGDESTAIASLKLGAADYVTKRDGYLDQLAPAIDRAVAHARLDRVNSQLREELARRERVEADRERLAAAVEQAAEVIVITDVSGTVRYVNPAFEAITGYARGDAVGRHLLSVEAGVPAAPADRAAWDALATGAVSRRRIVSRTRGGKEFTAEGTLSPVRDPAGAISGYVAVLRDITHELAVQAQLLQSQRMEGIGRLAGGVAHDFNNLLSVILAYTDCAVEALPVTEPMRADLLEVRSACDRAVAMTRQLLAFSRRQVMQPVPLSLNDVAAGMAPMLRRLVGEDIEFVQDLAPDLGVVHADPSQMEQVLLNLVVNARDSMPKGGKLTIETSNVELDEEYAASHLSVKPGSYVLLAVTDNGCGMDEQTKARLFEPFFTTKETGRGTGLGLSTVYGIVRQTGGNIWTYSEVGQGTTFKIYLPRDPVAQPVALKAAPPLRTVTGTETILLVEDDERLRKVSRRSLEAAGYTVLTAADGDEALRVAARHDGTVHLLFTDVVMPGMSGTALARSIAIARPAVKVLYTSGYTDDAIVHHGVLEAGTQFLAKPFTAAELTRKIRSVLDAPPPAP